MKKIILMLMLIMLSGPLYAADPNDLPNPTAHNPVRSCVDQEHNTLTVKIYIKDENMMHLVKTAFFLQTIKKDFYKIIDRRIRDLFEKYKDDWAIDKTLDVAKTESEKVVK